MTQIIESSHEFYEVLNEFPILKDKLESLDLDVKDLREGLTIQEYFISKSYTQDEIALLLRKFNSEVKQLLKGNIAPKTDFVPANEESLEEEE